MALLLLLLLLLPPPLAHHQATKKQQQVARNRKWESVKNAMHGGMCPLTAVSEAQEVAAAAAAAEAIAAAAAAEAAAHTKHLAIIIVNRAPQLGRPCQGLELRRSAVRIALESIQ